MASLIGKARKPKFELHLKIFDLNNVPLAVGSSYVKWHLTHSMHAEHRGRTSKCPIANHKVDFGFSKVISSVRISIDKNNNLTECPIELEVVQEFIGSEKTVLGNVRLNLSEYVEESEAYGRDIASLPRKRSNSVAISPTSAAPSEPLQARTADDGIVRRYLMQDSKVNCTLKVGILMIQMDGERNYIAPPLRTAPVFGGIAGFMGPEQAEDETGRESTRMNHGSISLTILLQRCQASPKVGTCRRSRTCIVVPWPPPGHASRANFPRMSVLKTYFLAAMDGRRSGTTAQPQTATLRTI
ncbi:hypothetical protein JDV02_010096 [Purpureocillium takamizusanense]|uniref:C2 NT-type domain-containing protein n=1 Tax=Purpureocillium takamizusanense TaxID=2060973 RepID=A0A9Q8QTE7_9HYPO|nr:uncharacterized protein JDV02_010096 [Purpureocillium takamizusanense]UNI24344.1 hypothetical protein JDV02_010096 [Purpureocillium takamizusanense]